MAGHRYIKRTGTPGNYRYWYKDASGRLYEGNADEQKAGSREHAKRLVAGMVHGHHNMNMHQIAQHVGQGVTYGHINSILQNMKAKGRQTNPNAENHAHHGHNYSEHHMKEAHTSPDHESYAQHVGAIQVNDSQPSASSQSRQRRSEAESRAAAASTPQSAPTPPPEARHEVSQQLAESRGRARARGASRRQAQPAAAPQPSPEEQKKAKIKELRERLKREHGIELSRPQQSVGKEAALHQDSGTTPPPTVRHGIPEPSGERLPERLDPSRLKNAVGGVLSRLATRLNTRIEMPRSDGDIETNGDGSVEISFRGDKSDNVLFRPDPEDDDDDHPEFVGHHLVLDAVREAMGNEYTVAVRDHEKGWFSVRIGSSARSQTPARRTTRKSFELLIEEDLDPVDFNKSLVVTDEQIKKSDIIRRIKKLKQRRPDLSAFKAGGRWQNV